MLHAVDYIYTCLPDRQVQITTMLKKYTITGVLIIIAIIAGFILLLRGCLAGYDERSAMSPALFFEKDGKGIVFTIVKYGETTSYKSNGGSTYKSLSVNYFIQSNDAETGELIDNKKIKHNSDVKFHPVTTMGWAMARPGYLSANCWLMIRLRWKNLLTGRSSRQRTRN